MVTIPCIYVRLYPAPAHSCASLQLVIVATCGKTCREPSNGGEHVLHDLQLPVPEPIHRARLLYRVHARTPFWHGMHQDQEEYAPKHTSHKR